MSAIDDLSAARAEMPEGMVTNDGNGFAIRHRRIVGEFDSGSGDAEFFVLAAQKVPTLKAERDAERAAWARFVKAAYLTPCGIASVPSADTEGEYLDALRGLLDLGVDVAALGVDVAQMLEAT